MIRDNWIYIQEPDVQLGRLQIFNNWSPYMVADSKNVWLGLEYFCFKGDGTWEKTDADLIAEGAREVEQLGLASAADLRDGTVIRMPKAYPIYDGEYAERVLTIRSWLDGLDNFVQVGRNGLHRYNNSDHSMLTAMRAVDNLHGARHDLWAVNVESAYLEEDEVDEQPYRAAPETPAMSAPLGSEA